MSCIFSFNLSTTDLIATGALIVSVISTLFAWWSWRESKNANYISLLNERGEIYRAFIELKFHMISKGKKPTDIEVRKFFWANKKAPFYFSNEIANDLEKYLNCCFLLASLSPISDSELSNDEKEKLDKCYQEQLKLSNEIEKNIQKLMGKSGT